MIAEYDTVWFYQVTIWRYRLEEYRSFKGYSGAESGSWKILVTWLTATKKYWSILYDIVKILNSLKESSRYEP